MIIKSRNLPLLTLLFFSSPSLAQITLFNSLKYEGNGCPNNSVDMRIDNGNTVRIMPRELKVQSPPSMNDFKECTIKVPLKAPKGYVFSRFKHNIAAYFIAHNRSVLNFDANLYVESNNATDSLSFHIKESNYKNINTWIDFSKVSTLEDFYYTGCSSEIYLIFNINIRARVEAQTSTSSLGVGGISIESFLFEPKENCRR